MRLVFASLFFLPTRWLWAQPEATAPFSEIPVVDASGAEGNPAAIGFGPVSHSVLSVGGDTSGLQTFALSGRHNALGAAYQFTVDADGYVGQEARLSHALRVGLGSSAGIAYRYLEFRGRSRLTADFGWQAAPWPFLRLGYYTRDALGNGSKPPLRHRFALGLRPLGHRAGESSAWEFGGGSEVLRERFEPYAYARLPLGGGLHAWGYWEPRSDRVAFNITASLRPALRAGMGSDRRQSELRLAFAKPASPRYGLKSPCARELDLNHTVAARGMPAAWIGDDVLEFETVLRRFDYLERDASARVVVLRLGRMRADFATAEELHERVLRLRARGKRVFAYLDPDVSPMNYLVASAADRIGVQPVGHFGVQGFAGEVTFYKGLLDKIGVEAQFLRHGKSKAFVEPFTRTDLSPEAKADLKELFAGWWSGYIHRVAAGRGIPETQLRALLEEGEIDLDSARARGLIDTLAQRDEIASLAMGSGAKGCLEPAVETAGDARWGDPGAVAVVALNGDISSGRSRPRGLFGGETLGAETVIDVLRGLRSSPHVRAVVLRVDSPGGLAQASDEIARAIDLLRKQGKTVVVSVGGVAASGAYYIACRADAIVAEPSSVVGSIGVVWGKVVTRGLYGKLGVTRDGVQTAPHADAVSAARPWSDEEIIILQRHLDRFYATFLDKVREGRRGKVKNLDSAAEGRIFTGTKALALGLIDTLGGLDLAIREAARLAKLPAWEAARWVRVSPPSPGISGLVSQGPLSRAARPLEELSALADEWQRPQLWALDPALSSALGSGWR